MTNETDFDFENATVEEIEKEVWRLFNAIAAGMRTPGSVLSNAHDELDREQCRKQITDYGSKYAHALSELSKRKTKLYAEGG
jgi:hypothetical protein